MKSIWSRLLLVLLVCLLLSSAWLAAGCATKTSMAGPGRNVVPKDVSEDHH